MDDSELDSATRSSSTSVRAYIRPCLMSSCVAVALLVILSLVVLLPVFYDTLSTDEDMQYGVVFSVEADHTHMLLYQWNGKKIFSTDRGVAKATDTAVVKLAHQCNVSYGVNDFVANISLAGLSLTNCLKRTKCSSANSFTQCIPANRVGSSKSYLGGTDSLRVLDHRNHSLAREILNSTHWVIKDEFPRHERSYILEYEEENAAMIVGWNEMAYNLPPRGDHLQLFGVVSLGELSAHVVLGEQFLLNDTSDRTKHVHLYNTSFEIYSKVDHCYGWNESLRRLTANLTLQSNLAQPTILHPCLPVGYHWNITSHELFIAPCTNWTNSYNSSEVFRFTGNATRTSCSEAVDSILFDDFPKLVINDSYNLTEIYAFSRYHKVMQFFNITSVTDDITGWSQLEHVVMSYCELSWDQIRSTYPSVKERILYRQCYDGTLVYTLLQASGFVPTSQTGVWSIYSQQSEVPWPMGLIVEKSRNIAANPLKNRPYSDTMMVIGLLTLTMLVVLFLFVLAYGLKSIWSRTKHYQNGYIQISPD
ncbi:ectonucleoside triphosphate diphosphohydrolase 1-like [Dysidea avara]|uniref:ectonucleoside triphosphate diphosphohydrolase 1-like n=1 Tax=Dysidea avara TaxID=196820 RepID=UPI003332A4D1